MSYFKPISGQLLLEATTTPSQPFQFTLPSGAPLQEQMMALRVLIYDGATEVHLAYGSTVAQVNAIAGTGGTPTAGQQVAGVMTFGCAANTVGVGFLDYIVLPSASFISVWSSTSTADVYLTSGQETAH